MASAVQDGGDSPRAQARNGVLAWARAAGRGVRTATPYGIFAFLTASALAPVAVPSLGLSGEFAAALGQLGGMGTNYLTDVLTGAATRMRDDQQSPSPEEWRDTLADLLVPRLEASAGLRAEVGELLESVDAVGLALAEGTAELRIELADAVRELGGEFAVSARVLAEVQQQLAMLSADQRLLLELTRRSLLSIVQLRQELPPAAGAAPGPGRAPAGRTQRSRAELRTAEPGTTEPATQPGATQPAEKEAGGTQPGPTQLGPTQPGAAQPGESEPGGAEPGGPLCPFPGLASFQTSDAEWFFGREALVAGLLGRLVERLTGGGPMVVVGASGAGKSSVLRAGLLPTLARDGLGLEGSRDWPWLLLTPGPRPLQELATQTAGLLNGVDALNLLRGLREMPDGYGAVAAQAAQASGPDAARLVIVVDQFEELFTQCTDEAERAAFVTALTSAGPALVVLAVRADFYPQCTRLAALAPALAAGQVVVGPLTRDGLTRAVHGPAERAGLAVEPGLVEVLLADLGAHPAADPGPVALPLLAHALRATWQRRRGHTLTVAGYRATGGIADAVAETAEAIHAGLDEPGRAALRAGLLRMVTVTEAGAVVRRRAALDELPQPALVRLVAARLVTVSEDSAEISHEALLAAWPRLAGWVADARQDLVLRHRLGEAARYWREAGRDPGSLYRGARLAQAREWADGRDDLTAAEAGFLAASAAGADAALRTERRRTRLLRRLVAALAVLLLAVPAVTAVAFTERGAAQQRQQDADRQRAEAVSRQFAAESVDNTDADPRRAMLLALAAWESRHTVEARSALLSAQSLDHAGELGDQPGGRTVAISPDGSLVAIGRTSGAVELWDARTHRQRALVRPASGKTAFAVRFSPDGKLLAAASVEQNGLRVWEVPSGRLRYTLPGAVSVAWGAGGTSLAAPYPDLRDPSRWLVNVWDAATGRLSHALPVGGRLPARVAYSADGGRIATGNGDGTVSLLRVSDGALLATLGGHGPGAVAVAFAPDGTLATGGANGTVQLWDWRTGRRLATLLEQGDVTTVIALAFTPDSGVLLVAGGSVQIRLWLMATRELLGHFSGGPTVLDVGVSGDGRTVVGTGLGAPTGLWRRATHILGHPTGAVVDVAYDPTGGTLASTGADHTVRLWDTATGKARATVTLPDQVLRAASSPDGTLAVAVLDGTVRLLDRTGRIRATLGLGGREPDDVAFSPDGRLLAAASSPPLRRTRKAEPGTVIYLWDARTLQQRGQIHLRDPEDDSIAAITFTPDGGRLLAAMTLTKIIGRDGDPAQTGRVRIWRTADLTETPAIAMGSEQVVTVAVSPDGRTLAAGGTDRTIGLWALVSGKPIGDRFGTHPAAIRSIAFSPDGSVLATTNIGDGTVRLWDLRSRIVVASVAGHFEGVNAVIFAPGGRSVASAGEDGGIGLWDTGPDRVEAALCQILAGPTFATEWADVTRRAPAGTVAPAPPCR